MNNIIRELGKVNFLIEETKLSIECVENSPLYPFVKDESLKEIELDTLHNKMSELANKRYKLFEDLQIEAEKQKVLTSSMIKNITLTKNRRANAI
ncbi:hypothetical protein [Myroides odoratimimus]|uniref:hypothetical protein n=1 Tax=Myroides odoratimimus TaxID=76832 RepID=UPI000468F018|nr:hypothetical protein [Myroides odoratimimus]